MAANGDSAAFAAIYERYLQQLHRYCTTIVGNAEDASDCLQSAMLKAFGALQSSTREIALKPWLYRIAHNESISLLRRRRPAVEADEENMGASPPAEADLATRERLSHLMADLRELPERQRGAIVLRELNGLEVSEIASWLGTSEGAARQTLFQGRRALHEFSEGRDMDCQEVREALSDNDRRRITNRKVRSHLRECAGCRDYKAVMDARSTDLKAIAPPLPAVLAAGLVKGFFGGGASGHALGAGGASGVGATKGLGIAGFGAKAAATVAATVVVGGAAVGVNRVIETQREGSVAKPPSAPAPRGGSGPSPAVSDRDAGANPSNAGRDEAGASRRASRRAGKASPARQAVSEDSAATTASLTPDSGSTGDSGLGTPVPAVTLSPPSAPSRPAPSPPSDGTRGKRRLTANPAPRSGSGGGDGSTSCEGGGDGGRVEAARSRRRTAGCSPQRDEDGRPRKGRGRDRSENKERGSAKGPKPKTDENGGGKQGEGRSDEPQGDGGGNNGNNGGGNNGNNGGGNGNNGGHGGGGQIPVGTPPATPPVKVAGPSAAADRGASPAPPGPAPALAPAPVPVPARAPVVAPPPAAPAEPPPSPLP